MMWNWHHQNWTYSLLLSIKNEADYFLNSTHQTYSQLLETLGFFQEEDVLASGELSTIFPIVDPITATVMGSTIENIVDNSLEANDINWQQEFGVSI